MEGRDLKRKNIIITIFILSCIIAGLVLWFTRFPEIPEPVFTPAPDFTLNDAYGNEVRLSDFKDKVVILDFWATWCPPCKAEIPHFIELQDEYKDQGLEIIGISLDWNGHRIVAPFAEENGINYTLLLGNEEITDSYGGIMSIPTTFVIDRESRIRNRYIGYRDKEVFEGIIKELL